MFFIVFFMWWSFYNVSEWVAHQVVGSSAADVRSFAGTPELPTLKLQQDAGRCFGGGRKLLSTCDVAPSVDKSSAA